jgi:hypothetical protein
MEGSLTLLQIGQNGNFDLIKMLGIEPRIKGGVTSDIVIFLPRYDFVSGIQCNSSSRTLAEAIVPDL